MAVCRSFKVTMVFSYWQSSRHGLYGRLRFSYSSFNSEHNIPKKQLLGLILSSETQLPQRFWCCHHTPVPGTSCLNPHISCYCMVNTKLLYAPTTLWHRSDPFKSPNLVYEKGNKLTIPGIRSIVFVY